MFDDVEEPMLAHRIADLLDQVCTTLWRVDVREVHDRQIRIFHCAKA